MKSADPLFGAGATEGRRGSTTAAAFDTAAAAYDDAFTHRPLPRLLRGVVWEYLEQAFRPGDRVLELGCGTGEDAVRLARRGIHVTATDAAPAMLEAARRKAGEAGVAERTDFRLLDLETDPLPVAQPATATPEAVLFDGAFSNFGALNCVADRRRVAMELARRLPPGAPAILVVMGPFCPWEVGWYLLRFSPGTALRRLRPGGVEARVGVPPRPVRVRYPSPRRLAADFSPWFRQREAEGLGVVLPPPGLSHVLAPGSGLWNSLARWDRRLGRRFLGSWLSDHYLLRLERTREPAGERTPERSRERRYEA